MDDKIGQFIKNYCREMHGYKEPLEIEKFKKVMKKNVKLFDRNSLLSYMLMRACGKSFQNQVYSKEAQNKRREENIKKNPQKREEIQKNDSCVQLWTNVFFFNDDKQNEFVGFISQTSGISKDSIKSIRRMKHCSFIDVDKNISEKVLQAFSSPLVFEKWKVVIRPARGRINE